jgi:hypothetical protein
MNQWHMFDCHIHTPASSDYQQPEVTYLDILQRAESRGLDIIVFTDHNTIAGYRHLHEDIQQLTLLEKLNRLIPEERQRLTEYRRLLSKLLVLPGFEFTATFGFHIIGIFPTEKPIREIEHLLLQLNIPSAQLDDGSATVGATTDVLTAYRMINEGGGLVIAAHANSSNGVAMRGFTFGGQTKIAYTQDPNLHALEVTDLEQKGPRTTAAFFNGTKPEYPRRMHCIQGSDAHRLTPDTQRKKNLSIGERATEVALPEVSFDELKELFESNDFSRTRPHRHKEEPAFDFIQAARDEGPNIIQDFHESMTIRGGKIYAIIADVCAFANTNGGTLYLGLGSEPKKAPVGVQDPENAITELEKEINNRISPPLQTSLDVQEYKTKKLIRVLVPRGENPPYAVDDNKIYVRDEAETGLAVRDEIVSLVLRGNQTSPPIPTSQPAAEKILVTRTTSVSNHILEEASPSDVSPKTGVEVLPNEEREGTRFYSMRDLRNGNIVKNVTRASARKLWHYAITQYVEIGDEIEKAVTQWLGNYGLLKKYKQGNNTHYDLIQKTTNGYRFFFGVTLDGIHGPWKALAGEDEV